MKMPGNYIFDKSNFVQLLRSRSDLSPDSLLTEIHFSSNTKRSLWHFSHFSFTAKLFLHECNIKREIITFSQLLIFIENSHKNCLCMYVTHLNWDLYQRLTKSTNVFFHYVTMSFVWVTSIFPEESRYLPLIILSYDKYGTRHHQAALSIFNW